MKTYKKEKYKNKEDWYNNHTKFLGGSSAGTIYGVNKWKSILELYNDIVNDTEHKEITNENISLGVASEPLIRKTFALNFPNYKVRNPKGWESYIRLDKPYLGATVDGILTDKETNEKGILEIKTFDVRRKEDLEEWNGKIPMQYYCQVIHYLMVMTDCKFVKVVAQLRMFDWNSSESVKVKELRTIIKHIERADVEADIKKLEDLETDFWTNHIETRTPPTYIRKAFE